MSTNEKTLQKKRFSEEISENSGDKRFLILHNDDVNTFEHVIDCLVDVADHEYQQAEQCAYITHYKGKCDIKKGVLSTLRPIMKELIDRGLNVTID